MADQNILVQVGADISNLTSGLNQASTQVSGFARDTQQGFQALGDLGKIITGFGIAAAAGLGGAVKVAADFDTAIRKAGAIAGASASELNDMKAAALDLGATTSKSAKEVANAMTELAAKGFDANQTIAAMPGIIKAAEASGEDLALVSDTITSALNAFRMEASEANKVADIMAMTANKSAAGIIDMQYAFKYASPAAAQLGISIEELAAATGIMANAGIKGETAGTTLRMAMLRLVKPPKQAKAALEKLGVTVTDQNGKFKSLQTLIGELSAGMEGMTEAQKTATIGAIFGAEAMSGMMTLIGQGPAALGEFTTALENSGGMAAKTAEQMKAGIGGSIERLKGSIESLVISIGDQLVPYVIKVAEFLSKVVNHFNGLSDATKKFIVVGAALTAIFALFIGPLLIMIGLIPLIVEGFGAIALMFGTTSAALLGVIGTVLGVIAALVAIGIGLVIAYQKVEWFRDMVDAAWAWIKDAWNTALDFIIGIVKSVMSAVAAFIGDRLSDIKKWWSENGKAISEDTKLAWALISGIIRTAMGVISMVFQTIFPVIVGIIKVAWAVIQAIFSTAFNLILGIFGTFAKLLSGDVKGAMDTVKNTFVRIWDNIVNIFKGINLADIGRNIVQGLVNGIKSMASAVGKAVSGIASAIPAKIKSFLGIHSPSRVLMELGEFTGEGFAKGIESMVRKVEGVTSDMANAALPEAHQLSLAYDVPNVSGANYTVNAERNEGETQQQVNLERMFEGANITLANGYDVREMMREAYGFAANTKRRRGQR
jgi:TP901 family phage tail tape measure protein